MVNIVISHNPHPQAKCFMEINEIRRNNNITPQPINRILEAIPLFIILVIAGIADRIKIVETIMEIHI